MPPAVVRIVPALERDVNATPVLVVPVLVVVGTSVVLKVFIEASPPEASVRSARPFPLVRSLAVVRVGMTEPRQRVVVGTVDPCLWFARLDAVAVVNIRSQVVVSLVVSVVGPVPIRTIDF